MQNKIYLVLSVLVVIVLCLFSCGKDSDTTQVMKEINRIKTSIVPPKKSNDHNNAFVLKKYEANEAVKLRSPFEGNQNLAINKIKSNKPLLLFPVDVLRFVGTVSKDNTIQAYILTPDNKIYVTSVGEMIGSQNAKVILIDSRKIEILESGTEPGNASKQQIITMELKGASK